MKNKKIMLICNKLTAVNRQVEELRDSINDLDNLICEYIDDEGKNEN